MGQYFDTQGYLAQVFEHMDSRKQAPLTLPAKGHFAPTPQDHFVLQATPRPRWYAFCDGIEYRWAPWSVDDGNYPPRTDCVAHVRLDCIEIDHFWTVLQRHRSKHIPLFDEPLSAQHTQDRRDHLVDLFSAPDKAVVLSLFVGRRHQDFEAILDAFPPMSWTTLTDIPSGKAQPLGSVADAVTWGGLSIARTPDMRTDAAEVITAPFPRVGSPQQPELLALEEVFSLNHIPDARLPPSDPLPGPATPSGLPPLLDTGLQLRGSPLYWRDWRTVRTESSAALPSYSEHVPWSKVAPLDPPHPGHVYCHTDGLWYRVAQVGDGVYLLVADEGQQRMHSLVADEQGLHFGTVFALEDFPSQAVSTFVWHFRLLEKPDRVLAVSGEDALDLESGEQLKVLAKMTFLPDHHARLWKD